jgi:hypothetical protein
MNINSVLFQTAAFGDYIFLIMIVLASIIQAIAQNKKKKVLMEQDQERMVRSDNQAPEVMGQKPERMSGYDIPADNIFDAVGRMLTPEPEEKEHIWGDDYLETLTAEKNAKVPVESTTSSEEKLIPGITEKSTLLFPPKPVKVPASSYKSRIREGFSLKKAVIYSEILNRKYT